MESEQYEAKMSRRSVSLRRLYFLAFLCLAVNVIFVVHHFLFDHGPEGAGDRFHMIHKAEKSKPRYEDTDRVKANVAVGNLGGGEQDSLDKKSKDNERRMKDDVLVAGPEKELKYPEPADKFKDLPLEPNAAGAKRKQGLAGVGDHDSPAEQNDKVMKDDMVDETKNQKTVTDRPPYFDNCREADRLGPGLMGEKVQFSSLSGADKQRMENGKKNHAFNEFASAKMSLHRTVPDARYDECKNLKYPHDLPTTSIIICFHNEAWSTLLRTIHSILDRSPVRLIHEIILVDDASNLEHLREQLDDYIALIHEVRIRIVRTPERVGLIRARMMGVDVMEGEIITFLDSHVEVMTGWLEPLLSRVAEDRTRVVLPVVDEIDSDTLKYGVVPEPLQRGGFNWRFQYRWVSNPGHDRRPSKADPIRSPAMPGGLLTMDKEFFLKLGGYDPGMEIWGGENLEESLKIWMCGGSIEILPCSRVGHIYRNHSPYSFLGKNPLEVAERNAMRVVEVWTDEYKDHFYNRLPHLRKKDFGDVQSRRELRKTLDCKSFEWYLQNIYKELYVPNMKTMQKYSAQVASASGVCLDSNDQNGQTGKRLIVWGCHGMGGNQYFELTDRGQMRNDELCLEPDMKLRFVLLTKCKSVGKDLIRQKWEYEGDRIKHLTTRLCLTVSKPEKGTEVVIRMCRNMEPNQIWTFS